MKNTQYVAKLVSRFFAFFFVFNIQAGTYYQELEVFKRKQDVAFIFNDKANPQLKQIVNDINTYKKLSIPSRLVRFIFSGMGVIVDKESMPKMYDYIKNLCLDNDIEMPVVFISKDKSIFNAFALKLFTSSGGILLGQELLSESSDEEIEAVIAHEIGHIKHNHVNKIFALNILVVVLYSYITTTYYTNDDYYKNNIIIEEYKKFWKMYGLLLCARALVIGKSFEKEADNFACQQAGKAKGLIKFFKKLESKEVAKAAEFEQVKELLQVNKNELSLYDYNLLYRRYFMAKIWHSLDKLNRWIYHNTPFGAHPSNKDRIAAAEKYLEKA